MAKDVEGACMHAWIWCNHHLENIMRKITRATRTMGNTNSNRIPGGEMAPIKDGPKTSIIAIIRNATIDPRPHTSGCFIFFPHSKWRLLENINMYIWVWNNMIKCLVIYAIVPCPIYNVWKGGNDVGWKWHNVWFWVSSGV